MPPKARIDALGALHHIIVRGFERRRIFSDDQDRDNFVERLGDNVTETQICCFAWALIPKHVPQTQKTLNTPIKNTILCKNIPNKFIYFLTNTPKISKLFVTCMLL